MRTGRQRRAIIEHRAGPPHTKTLDRKKETRLLSDADRERVRLEEVFREEVRKTLEKPKTSRRKVYDFFNSSLGIFILSSILLASLSAGVTKWLESNQREAQARETIRRLDIEIAHRLQQLPVLSRGVITYTQMHTAKGAVFGKAENHPQVGKLGEFEPIFPEFLGRTLFFLIGATTNTTSRTTATVRSRLNAGEATSRLLRQNGSRKAQGWRRLAMGYAGKR